MAHKKMIGDYLQQQARRFTDAADQIWDFAEVEYHLPHSADVLCRLLQEEGFSLTRGVAGMEDAFVAEYGTGQPVIGFLAEYDALAGMNQKSQCAEKCQTQPGGAGHGCQHHLLGVGAVAGAAGLKAYMQANQLSGCIRVYGCPAEESGYGKAFMARDGVFDGADVLLTWHPGDLTALWDQASLAVIQGVFHFKGLSSHAGSSPELGRSALDAAELMNVGANFLREHMIDQARLHYAFLDAGGTSANVVQPTASLLYYVRAPKMAQAKAVYDRLVKVAQGAAMMTETQVQADFRTACANYRPNRVLGQAMVDNIVECQPLFDAEDFTCAQPYFDQLTAESKQSRAARLAQIWPDMPTEQLAQMQALPLHCKVPRPTFPAEPMKASTDVGDASWVVPTAQAVVATAPAGTPAHSWQWVAVGKTALAHKGMLAAGQILAATAVDLLNNPAILQAAWQEHRAALEIEPYQCVIPEDVKPV